MPALEGRAIGELAGGAGKGRDVPVLPDVDSLEWEQVVGLVRQIDSGSRWLIGDIASGVAGSARYGEGTLAVLARDAGMGYATLRDYKRVAEAYPAESVDRSTHPWSVFRVLAGREDRQQILSGHPGCTVAEARSYVSEPVPAQAAVPQSYVVGGLEVTREQALTAISALRATRATAIRQTLRAKGSPLADVDYWMLVKQHKAAVPGHGQEGAKIAFIHHLEDAVGVSSRAEALTDDCRSFAEHVMAHLQLPGGAPGHDAGQALADAYASAGKAYKALGLVVGSLSSGGHAAARAIGHLPAGDRGHAGG